MSSLRYLAPNAVTALGMIFGLASLVSAHQGHYAAAGYFIIWAVLMDNLDGPIARALKASSEFGAQMDSFADFLNFGVAPGYLVYISFRQAEVLGYDQPGAHALLAVACAGWALAAMVRLAKFGVIPETKGLLFGVPTTLAAGLLAVWYLVLLKYAPEGSAMSADGFFDGEPRFLGVETLPLTSWSYLPPMMIAGALLMVSNLPMPKLGGLKNKLALGIALMGVAAGYIFNTLRMYPDALMWLPSGWLIYFLVWAQFSPKARTMRPPPIFRTSS